MVTFQHTPYGLKLTFSGTTSSQNVSDFLEQAPAHYAQMPPKWRLLVDLREAKVMQASDFERVAAFVQKTITEPSRIAMIVTSSVLALQIKQLFRTADGEDIVSVFDLSVMPDAESAAIRYIA
jgi:hypothetical protein